MLLFGFNSAFNSTTKVEYVVVVGDGFHALLAFALNGEFYQSVHKLFETYA